MIAPPSDTLAQVENLSNVLFPNSFAWVVPKTNQVRSWCILATCNVRNSSLPKYVLRRCFPLLGSVVSDHGCGCLSLFISSLFTLSSLSAL